MTRTAEPVMRMIGGLRQRGIDWTMPEFAHLFERLGAIADENGAVTRYVGYYGDQGKHRELRLFGIEVPVIRFIPEGMMGFELGIDTIKIFEPITKQNKLSWQAHLQWDWLEDSGSNAPVGEFKVTVPPEWISHPNSRSVEFTLSANTYSERGKSADDDVRLVEYDSHWPDRFQEMARWIRNEIPAEVVVRVEHYGSTAIPNMPAKPIIDILLEVPSFAEARRTIIPIFNRPGCEYWWYDDHMYFIVRDRLNGARTHHIHVAPAGHRVWQGLAFRDYLCAHPDDAARYAALKRELADRHATDREAYTDSKGDFVREVTAKALDGKFSSNSG